MLHHGEKFSQTESRDWLVKLRLGLGLGLMTSPNDVRPLGLQHLGLGLGLGLKLYWEKFYKAIWILAERL